MNTKENLLGDQTYVAEIAPRDYFEHMLTLAPLHGISVEIVAEPGERVAIVDSLAGEVRSFSVPEGNVAIITTIPKGSDTGPFRLALREAMEPKKTE